MKTLTKIFSVLATLSFLATSCDIVEVAPEIKDSATENTISTDKAVYEISQEGGTVEVLVKSASSWTTTIDPASSLDVVDDFKVTPESAASSNDVIKVTVSADANDGYNRAACVSFLANGISTAVTVNQKGAQGERILVVSCAEFVDKPVDASIFYEVTGKVTKITDEYYNDFYINDGTLEGDGLYVYGLYESKGASRIYYYLQQMDIREGDILTMRANRGQYGDTIEATNAFYVKHEKSKEPSIKLDLEEKEVAAVGDEFTLKVTSNVVTWNLSSNVDWLSFDLSTANESKDVTVTVAPGEPAEGIITLSAEGLQPVTCKVNRVAYTLKTIAEAIAVKDKTNKVEGIVTAISGQGYILTDDTASCLIYSKSLTTFNIGDKVSLVGTSGAYNNGPQLASPANETLVTAGSGTYNYPNPKNIDEAAANAYATTAAGTDDIKVEYAKMIGTLSVSSGKYFNIILSGTDGSGMQGSVYQPSDAQKEALNALNGKIVELRGMVSSVSKSSGSPKYVNLVMTSVKESGAVSDIPFSETFAESLGDFEVKDIDVAATKTGTVWSYDSSYKYMKATAGQKCVSESMLVSPLINLSNVTTAKLSFEHTQKYAVNVYEELTVWVSIDGGEKWEQVLVPNYPDGKAWNFVTTEISLNKFAGNNVRVAFDYKSNADAYATWEIKNFKVEEGNVSVTNIAQLQGLAVNKDTKSDFTATLTDAVVTYVNGSNAFIEDATGGVLYYKSGHGLNVGDKINGSVSGKITIYGGFPEVTELNVASATVTPGATVTPVVITLDKLKASFNRYVSCQVKLENVKLDAALVSNGNRNCNVLQEASSLSAYAKIKTVDIAKDVPGSLICYPCYNNGFDKPQVGIWESLHFTPATD